MRGLTIAETVLAEVLWQLHQKFNLAKKPLNYISENLLQFKTKIIPFIILAIYFLKTRLRVLRPDSACCHYLSCLE